MIVFTESEADKQIVLESLESMPVAQQFERLASLTAEAAKRANAMVHIRQTTVQGENGQVCSTDQECLLQIDEKAFIKVQVENPDERKISIRFEAKHGTTVPIEADNINTPITYIVPNRLDGTDRVTVTILDKITERPISRKLIDITIIE